MKNPFQSLLVPVVLALAMSGLAANAAEAKSKAAEKPASGGAATEASKSKHTWYPFYGYVASVDKQARTISLKKKAGVRVLRLDDNSRLEAGGKAATLANVQLGDYAHGTLHKDSGGKEVIRSAKFDKEAPKKAKPALETTPQDKPAPKGKT